VRLDDFGVPLGATLGPTVRASGRLAETALRVERLLRDGKRERLLAVLADERLLDER
jgi:hypothetical protein